MKRKRVFAMSAARNAKLNSPRVVTPVNPEEERPRPQLSSSAHVSSVVLDSVTCPITQALVVRPAVAEDGKIYEYDAIKRWVRDNHRSPVTNSPIPFMDEKRRGLVRSLLSIRRVHSC